MNLFGLIQKNFATSLFFQAIYTKVLHYTEKVLFFV